MTIFNQVVVRTALIFAVTSALAASLPLVLLPILTRVLAPADYGLVAMYSIALTAFGALTGLSVHGAAAMKYFDRDEIDFPQYVGSCLAILVVSTGVVLLGVWIARMPLQALTALPSEWLMAAVLTSSLQFIVLIRLSIFQSAKQAALFGAFRISQSLIDAVLSLALVIVFALAWQGRLIGMSAAIALLGAASLISLWRGGWIDFKINKDYVRNALQFGLPLTPHVIGGMLLAMVDRFMITNMLDTASTGIYLVAAQIAMGVFLIGDACNRAINPWFIEAMIAGKEQTNVRIVRGCYLFFTFLILMAVTVGLVAPWLVSILVGKAFHNAAPLVMLLALGQAFGCMYVTVANVIFYKQKIAYLAAITLSCGLLNVLLSYLLLPVEGLIGAAQAYLIVQITLFLASLTLAQIIYPLPWIRSLKRMPSKKQCHDTSPTV